MHFHQILLFYFRKGKDVSEDLEKFRKGSGGSPPTLSVKTDLKKFALVILILKIVFCQDGASRFFYDKICYSDQVNTTL